MIRRKINMNKFFKVLLITTFLFFGCFNYARADAPAPTNLSLKGIVDWIRLFQFVEYGTVLPSAPSTRGVWFILWVSDEPALYWSNGSEWIPFVTASVQDGSITTDSLADNAVTTPKIANGSITEPKLANGAVTTNKIADNAVTGTKFANNSITTSKLAPLSVTSEKLGNLSVTTGKISTGAVTSEKMETTLKDKNLILNNGQPTAPSLSFTSSHYSGLSYDPASTAINISVSYGLKEKIGTGSVDFYNIPNGLNVNDILNNSSSLYSDGLQIKDSENNKVSLNKVENWWSVEGDLIPSGTYDLGSSTAKWNNLFVDDILADNASVTNLQVKNIKLDNGSIYPLTTGTGEVGTDTLKFKSGSFNNLDIDNVNIDLLKANNASITYNITTSKLIASESVNTDTLIASGSYLRNIYINENIMPIENHQTRLGGTNRLGAVYTDMVDSMYIQLGYESLQNRVVLGGDRVSVDGSLKDVFIIHNDTIPSGNNQSLGISSNRWKNIYATNLNLNGNLYPSSTNSGEVGTSTYKFKSGEFVTLNSLNLMPSDNNSTIGDDNNFWKNIVTENAYVDYLKPLNYGYILSDNILPESDNLNYIGTDTSKFSDIWIYNSNVDKIYFNKEIDNTAYLEKGNLTGNPQLKSSMDLIPSTDNTLDIGRENLVWKTLNVNNASITQNLTVAKIIASETVETTYLNAITASFTNLNINNNLEVKGIASVTSLLVNGNPVSGVENLKFPRGTLSVDVDCGKYSLRSLGKDLVLFSDAFMMIDYNITDDGNYFTFKSGNASPTIMEMDSEIASLTSLTIRLDYENIMSENSESILFGLENEYADHIITLYALNKKLYLRIDDINELMDFNYDSYDWSEEHNIYLTVSIDNNIYYGLNIDGVEVYQNSNSITFTQFDIARVKIGAGYGSGGYYTTLKDYNAKYRRIQIYPYVLSLKEKISIPLLQPIVDQQRELSKNMTRCPYYTLGEPSTLIGGDFNEGEGFFGEVSGDKFIYGWEVLGQLWGMDMNVIDTKAKFIASFTEVFGSNISYTFTGDSYTELGVSDNLEVEWLKFYDNGYIIFIPKRPLLNNITWYEINNVLGNCAVGKEIKIDLRRMNPLINSTYSNGNLISVRCRLMTGGNIQPFIYGNINERGVKNNALCMGSEWNRLMYRICDQIPSDTFAGVVQGYSGGKQIGDNWFNFTGSDLGFNASNDLGRVTFTQEYCYYQNTAYVLHRANVPGVGLVIYNAPSGRSPDGGFRPALVLEVLSQ